jgi:hypothetical protein
MPVSLSVHILGAIWWSQLPEPISTPSPEEAVIELTLELVPEPINSPEPIAFTEVLEREPDAPELLKQPDTTEIGSPRQLG